MSYFPIEIMSAVDDVADVRYIGRDEVIRWNTHRREGELRLLCGYAWFARKGNDHRQGFKSYSAAVRDAYYVLVAGHRRLRLVRNG